MAEALHINPQKSVQNEAGSSFAIQYTSVMLIVLAFTIGSFIRPTEIASTTGHRNHYPSPVQKNLRPEHPIPPSAIRIGKMEYTQLFNSSGELDSARGFALAEFLMHHDVVAEIALFQSEREASSSSERTAPFDAINRGVLLSQYLIEMGVPAEAFRVQAAEEEAGVQARISFRSELSREALDEAP